jgi:hypothetical protein
MSTLEEQIATAIVAKMAGTTLTEVDRNTINQSSSGPATKIDPKSFLPGVQQYQQNQYQQQIDYANSLAEQMHPLPQQTVPAIPLQAQPAISSALQTFTVQDPNQLTFDFLDEATTKKSLKQLDLIVDYLYSINNKLDKVLNKRD